uniref:FRIGIDA-like protein 3 isoform X2 n=1 Tax=Fragaria vesca subsp. vesca TaxID=101020 RepID=UPI0005C8FA58|nr:PREDICTED: FRIGIDA-like protein 3 isoform X2 [Fragaria vesca subsp. vesca]
MQEEASSTLLRLTKRLKDMEGKFRSTRIAFLARCEEVEERERKLAALKAEAENKEAELRDLERLIEEKKRDTLLEKEQLKHATARDLQLMMSYMLMRRDLVVNEVSAALRASEDPAQLVLDAMKEFYPSDDSVGDGDRAEFDTVVVYRRSCVALLEELKKMKITRETKTRVREEAMKMASDWKGKMKVADENWLEALGFLLLVTTYGLTYAFDTTELQDLLIIVAQQEQATELCRDLGIIFKQAPGNLGKRG